VACDTNRDGLVVIAGEITTKACVDFQNLVRGVVASIGFETPSTVSIPTPALLSRRSTNSQATSQWCGHRRRRRGMMFGYASNENADLMPTPISLAHKLTLRPTGSPQERHPSPRPDGKSQVTVEYDELQTVPDRCGGDFVAARRDFRPKSCAPTS
jgi:S-adenosylmethionine synthetase